MDLSQFEISLLTGVAIIWLIGQLIFHGFEKHLSLLSRLLKLIVMLALAWVALALLGEIPASILLGALALLTLIFQFTVFPHRGIRPFTAEPYGEYTRWLRRAAPAWGPLGEFQIVRVLRRERWRKRRRSNS